MESEIDLDNQPNGDSSSKKFIILCSAELKCWNLLRLAILSAESKCLFWFDCPNTIRVDSVGVLSTGNAEHYYFVIEHLPQIAA